ncbi:hypothetical protein [Parasulfitobacter algicola]|uniref:Uncharacterized protein n=1 Tax=Parasulfitobacter algicola TaxID=2614809 RepID=A0ABX2J1G8_9RHOB|nr:hypothetical protein [Sulfitobacter algicola]NSX56753.1 hypothetical protein [Sulfitobacter algicola]
MTNIQQATADSVVPTLSRTTEQADFNAALMAQNNGASVTGSGITRPDPLKPNEIRFSVSESVSNNATVTAADVTSTTNPATKEKIASIRNEIANGGGINQTIANKVENDSAIEWADVLDPGIYAATAAINLGPATGLADHRHFIRIPADGTPAQIINAGPSSDPDVSGVDQTKLNVQVMDLGDFLDSYSIGGQWNLFKAQNGSSVNEAARWGDMQDAARQIGTADLNYNFREQNSNSVARTVADAGDLNVNYLGPLPVGWANNLRDEINGGSQPNSEDGNFRSPSS